MTRIMPLFYGFANCRVLNAIRSWQVVVALQRWMLGRCSEQLWRATGEIKADISLSLLNETEDEYCYIVEPRLSEPNGNWDGPYSENFGYLKIFLALHKIAMLVYSSVPKTLCNKCVNNSKKWSLHGKIYYLKKQMIFYQFS